MSPLKAIKTLARKRTGTVASSAALIIVLTILVRPLGMGREILTAVYFGARLDLDTFLLASSVPVFLCTILGGGLAQAVVPGLLLAAKKDEQVGWRLLNRLARDMFLLALLIAGINYMIAPYVIRIIFPSNTASAILELGTKSYRILSPAIIGGLLSGLFIGAANAFHYYGYTTLRSVAYNGMIIGSLFFLHERLGIVSLGVGILLAEFSQLLFAVPPLLAHGFRPGFVSRETDKPFRIVLWAWIPAVLLTGMNQVNYFVDRILAMPLGEGSVSSLNYAWKLILLPAGLLSVAFATPLLSFLSHHEAKRERLKTAQLLRRTAETLIFFSVPVTFLLIICHKDVVSLFYQWGEFGDRGLFLTSVALFFYAPGLPFQLLIPVMVAAFMAVRRPWLPVIVSLPLVPINWLLDKIFMQFMYHAGIAFTTSVLFLVNAAFLYVILNRYLPSSREGSKTSTGRYIMFFIFAGAYFIIVGHIHVAQLEWISPGRLYMVIKLIITTLLTIGGYVIMAQAFDLEIMNRLERFWRRSF